jgi:hypothetical protein
MTSCGFAQSDNKKNHGATVATNTTVFLIKYTDAQWEARLTDAQYVR